MKINSIKHQQGAALAVGLILLLIITLMGYASMKGTILQERMAAGLHNRSLAYGAANSAVRNGEEFVYTLVQRTNGVNVRGTPGATFFNIYSPFQALDAGTSMTLNTDVEAFKQRDWTSGAGTVHDHNFTDADYNGALQRSPEYIVEELFGAASQVGGSQEFGSVSSGDANIHKAFLITGKGTSGDGNSIVLTQSLYTVVVSSSATN